MRAHRVLGLPALCNAACARIARLTTIMAGQREQCDSGAGGAARRVEVAVGEREHGPRDQQIPDDERQFAGEQRGDGGERAKPAPPGERTRDAPRI